MPPTQARGAKSPIKPGVIIKDALINNGPMSITALHGEYRDYVKAYNLERGVKPGGPRRSAGNYTSTQKLVYKLKRLGLIEWAGTEPMEFFPGMVNPLLSIRIVGRTTKQQQVVMSERILYQITDAGRAEIDAWESPSKAFMDAINAAKGVLGVFDRVVPPAAPAVAPPAPVVTPPSVSRPLPKPQPPRVAPPIRRPRPKPKPPVPQPAPVAVPDIKLPSRASTLSIERLSAHLEKLQVIQGDADQPSKELQAALDKLAAKMADWEIELEDLIAGGESGKQPSESQTERWELRKDVLIEAREYLEEGEIEQAIDALTNWE